METVDPNLVTAVGSDVLNAAAAESLLTHTSANPLGGGLSSEMFDVRAQVVEDAVQRQQYLGDLVEVITSRRTIGKFQSDRVVPEHVLLTALDTARWAPNHKKTEPWRVYRPGPSTRRRIIDLNTELITAAKGADVAASKRASWEAVPGWLIITCVRSDDALRHEEDLAACACFVQNLMLTLWAAGVGSKWSTGDVTRDPRFAEIVDFDPQGERVVGLIWYGYPDVIPSQTRQPVGTFLIERP